MTFSLTDERLWAIVFLVNIGCTCKREDWGYRIAACASEAMLIHQSPRPTLSCGASSAMPCVLVIAAELKSRVDDL